MLVARSSSWRCWLLHSRGVLVPWRGRESMRGAQCDSAPCTPVSWGAGLTHLVFGSFQLLWHACQQRHALHSENCKVQELNML